MSCTPILISNLHARSSNAFKKANPSKLPLSTRASMGGAKTPVEDITIEIVLALDMATFKRGLLYKKLRSRRNEGAWVCDSRQMTISASEPRHQFGADKCKPCIFSVVSTQIRDAEPSRVRSDKP